MAHGHSVTDPPAHGNPPDGWVLSPGLSRVPGLLHGFTVRTWGDFAGADPARRLLARTGARDLRLLRQVHGTTVVGADDATELPEGDAWAGRPPAGVLLGVCTADCLPVLLCHPPSGALGVAHAGWRGAVAGIAEATLKAMGVPAEETVATLGPAIGPCCYEVGGEVASQFAGDFVRAGCGGGFRLDLKSVNAAQLQAAGVPPESIAIHPACTKCGGDKYASYRRDGSRAGRMIALIALRP
jgi:hypothetical protein